MTSMPSMACSRKRPISSGRLQALTPMAEKAARRLMIACRQLCEALSKAGPIQRQKIITSLSQGLRQELISLREAQRNRVPDVLRTSVRRGLARLRGNIWCVKTAAGCYHRVRLTLNGVAVTSGRIITRPEASQLLRRLRGAAQSAEPDGPEAVLRALDAVGCHAASEDGLGLSYQVVLDARSSVGKRLHSPSCSVEEVIALRRQVSDLVDAGPIKLAQTWLRWSQEHRHCKGRRWRWSKEKAESIFSEMKHSSKAQHAGRMAKSLELKAQRAEKAMQEVARVSDAVSTAKRRWLPLGEAPGLLEAVEPCMRQLARVEPSTHGPHEIMTVTC
ncbi:unnamed protein product [Durusdinium trenchii]|uniref:CHAD domain-containing protein n=1 Tax=Durusdinium trenchii TaxID=1381693 RepID=A0ABP0P0W1_9DINO